MLAVDVGTCNTVAVVDRGDGLPRALLFDGSPLLSSAVFADPSGHIHVGRDAERLMVTDAARFEPNPKGRVDEGAVLLGTHEIPVSALLAAILRRVAAEAAQAGVPAGGGVVLTCPADWGPRRREVLLAAAGAAGLGRPALLDEPVAAATYCLRVLGDRGAGALAVFDFGGGTLDVTVVRRGPDGLRVLATGGLDDLGGTDIDAALVGHLGQLVRIHAGPAWQRLGSPHTTGELRDRRTFWSEVRAAKEMLSRAPSAPVQVPGSDYTAHLTREELERVAGPLVDRAVDETRRVLQRSGVPAVDTILLVGGSSRLPLVASRLHQRFGVAPIVPEQPELPVALGALLLANDTAAPVVPAQRTHPGVVPAGAAGAGPAQAYPGVVPAGAAGAASARAYPGAVTASAAAAAILPAYPGVVPTRAAGAAPAQANPGAESANAAMAPAPQVGPGPAPVSEAPVRAAPVRPAVVIGPGVTIQGSVGIYGDADLMPDDDEPTVSPPDERPEPEPRRRPMLRLGRLRFLALPLLPWALILTLTPWGRGLVSSALDAAQPRSGASPSAGTAATPSPSTRSPSTPPPSSPAQTGPRVVLDPQSGTVNTRITVTATGFSSGEKLTVYVGTRNVHTQTATATGTLVYKLTVGSGASAGAANVVVKVTGSRGGSGRSTFRINPG